MPNWKKVIVSGSSAFLANITASGDISASGKFIGTELFSQDDLTLDADGADILLKDGGTEFGRFKRDNSDFIIKSATSNKDIVFRGNDGGGTVDALTLDMSEGGKGIFTAGLTVTGSTTFNPRSTAGGKILLTNQSYSGLDNPIMTFQDAGGLNNVVIGHSANDGLINIHDQDSGGILRTVLSANFSAFDPGSTTGFGTFFGLTSSMAPTVKNNRAYIKIYEGSYSGAPAYNLQLNHYNKTAGSGSIGLYGIMSSTSTAAPAIQITSVNAEKVVNFGGPGFIHSNGAQNNYLKYGLQIGGDFTGNSSNMALTDGSLIMSGSTGGFSVKSVSSEAEIKTNEGDTTLTLGTTSSFSYVSASAFKGDGSQLTGISVSTPTLQQVTNQGATTTNDIQITGSLNVSGSGISFIASGGTVFSINNTGSFTLGEGATAANDTAVAIGKSANATSNGVSIGGNSNASLVNTVSIGGYSSVTGQTGIAIGYDADVSGYSAIGIGAYINNSAGRSVVFNATGDNAVNHSKASASAFYMTSKTIPDFEFVAGGTSTFTDSNLSGSATSTASFGTYIGDGSQLTNLPAASTPTLQQVVTAGASATGDVSITGSLTISGSANVFKFDQTALIIGQEAGNSLTSFSVDNTMLGRRAGYETSNGDQNVFVGDQAGFKGDHTQDTAVGYLAGTGYTGGKNVSVGWQAGYGAAAASAEKHNTQIGAEAGRNNWRGSGNTFIGYRAGYNGYDNEGCIIIGSGSIGGPDSGAGGLTQQLRIGNGSIHVISGSLITGDVIFYNTASAPNFSGSFQGDGSNLTGITAKAGSTSGRVVFTTTAGALTTEDGFDYNSSTNQLTVESLNVTHFTSSFITSSQILSSGSNILGDDTTDTQTLIGTTIMTGSAEVTGSVDILSGSLKVRGATALTGANIFEIKNTSADAFDDLFAFDDNGKITHEVDGTGDKHVIQTTSGATMFKFGVSAGSQGYLQIQNNGFTGAYLNNHGGAFGYGATVPSSGKSLYVLGDAEITGSLIVSGTAEFRGVEDFDTNVVIGKNATSTGQYSVVIGKDAGISSGGSENVVIGHSANLANNTLYNVVIGEGAYGSGAGSIAIGEGATAAAAGIAIGRGANVSDYRGIAIGKGATAGLNQLQIGNSTYEPIISGSLETGHIILSQTSSDGYSQGGLEVHGSGSNVFEVIGSEGTLFTIDDDLDGVIFTANNRTGNPVLQASASGEVYIGKAPQSLYTTAVISSTTAATTQSIFGLSTSSYGGAFFDYTVQSGSNARAGSIMSVWNGGNISFTETTTTDIGDTTDFNVIVHISQSQAQIASHATRAGYNIKTIIRSI